MHKLPFHYSIIFGMLFVYATMLRSHEVSIITGGDVTWSLGFRYASIIFEEAEMMDTDWRAMPRVNQTNMPPPHRESFAYLIDQEFQDNPLNFPLKKLTPIFQGEDIVFLNLETPLSDSANWVGDYRTPRLFAQALRSASVSLVNLANNHTYDCEAQGLLDTMESLEYCGVGHVGAGISLEQARAPRIIKKNGISLGFLGYTQFSNMGERAFAAFEAPGVAPMDPEIMIQDIHKLRSSVDFVIVAIHWGTAKSARVSPKNRELAHDLINAGADIILGGHSPHPKGLEIYKGKAIVYAQGHVIAGHKHAEWGHNYLVRFKLSNKKLKQWKFYHRGKK